MTAKKSPPLKTRLAAQLVDLRDGGGARDPEVARIVGGLAVAIADNLKQPDWQSAKKAMDDAYRQALFADFHRNAEARMTLGDGRHAYAIQLLGLSVAASTDPALAEGEALLDAYVAATERAYRDVGRRREDEAAAQPAAPRR